MLEFMRAGGPMLWLIIFFGLVGVYVFLEKFYQIRRNQVNVRELVTGPFLFFSKSNRHPIV